LTLPRTVPADPARFIYSLLPGPHGDEYGQGSRRATSVRHRRGNTEREIEKERERDRKREREGERGERREQERKREISI
jgi:hypothetical protein